MKMIAIGCIVSAVLIFWSVFFKLAPWLVNMIPACEWQKLLKVIVYLLMGYLGGIGIPIGLFFLGIYLLVNDL